jgi:hypothetical protein
MRRSDQTRKPFDDRCGALRSAAKAVALNQPSVKAYMEGDDIINGMSHDILAIFGPIDA